MKTKITLLFMLIILCGGMMIAAQKQQVAVQKTDTVLNAETMQSTVLDELREIRKTQLEGFEYQKKLQEQRQIEIEEFNKNQEGKKQSDIGVMAQIEDNTHERFWSSGWTLFALVTLGISIFTFLAQWSTERHTKNVSIDSQLGVLKDLPRHFYRNLVCTIAMLIKYRHADNKDQAFFKAYPSEANVMKLQTLSEEFILPIDTANNHIFDEMHEQKLLFKNYNLEVAAASNHFSRKKITEKSLVNDFDNILFKPIFLIMKLYKLYFMLNKNKWRSERMNPEIYVSNVLCTFVAEHFSKLNFNNIENEMQWKYYDEIYQDENFKRYIVYDKSTQYDDPEKPIISNGIERSLNALLGLLKDVELEYFLVKKKEGYFIDRMKFLSYFYRICEEELQRNKKFELADNILKTMKEDALIEGLNLKGKSHEAAVRSYLKFWRKDEWAVRDFLYNMLKLDSIFELRIVGMIEHEK